MKTLIVVVFAVAAALWLLNTSLLVTPPSDTAKILAHRGIHQVFQQEGVENDTCTAQRIEPPRHAYLENTIASMQAAMDSGAEVVELDIHLTPDRQFAVFHDWTLDCRTDGKGVTEQTPMTTLKTLDIGYGYTADGGKTFPFRGRAQGQMPTLTEVFTALPHGRFLINFKSDRREEGATLAVLLRAHPEWRKSVFGVYGGSAPTQETLRLVPGLRGYDRQSTLACLGRYVAYGWTSIVPEACHNTLVVVPANYAPFLWGWPDRFAARMKDAGSEVILLGRYGGGDFTSGIDSADDLTLVPKNFAGYVWTNRAETISPLLGKRMAATNSQANRE
ncbi:MULTISPECIES: glycerophosphodiester phosphodiesterase family protein [Sinorhizobium]|uniref:Glycerophosphodiester phosphodiesterase family protein n=1 Tax=Sinorhizobium psoraleae TaxID=520838 RepID=A0ABT4KD95_9HYPH|nr:MULTISPECIES: glycerophosphodiester phosphodiesterase family protein [Sinorhizobium]MCZ4089849.1 glycerophosphodiester phosphodiesterase family protein [Sinorhizobium psoraleae]MDK1384859.1 glycerophosphodiester phosphodiesterase family protein [Sinorhizobium sp. 7-81]